jgi:hypothetical protein
MNKKIIIGLCIFFFLYNKTILRAQAIRLNLLDYSSVIKGGDVSGFYAGFGYEQNVGDRIAVSLEYNFSYLNNTTEYDQYYNSSYYDNSGNSSYLTFDYFIAYPSKELAWQSKYFFNDNDEGSWYIASGIAYKSIKYNWGITDINADYNYPVPPELAEGKFEESVAVIPLSLKLGYRNSIDGIFGDYFIGINYNTGGSSPDDVILKNYLQGVIRKINFSFGLNFGFGWAK